MVNKRKYDPDPKDPPKGTSQQIHTYNVHANYEEIVNSTN